METDRDRYAWLLTETVMACISPDESEVWVYRLEDPDAPYMALRTRQEVTLAWAAPLPAEPKLARLTVDGIDIDWRDDYDSLLGLWQEAELCDGDLTRSRAVYV